MRLEFIVPGQPVAKARPRVTSFGHAYTPKKTKQYEALVAGLAKKQWTFPPMHGALKLQATFIFKRPKRLMRKADPEGRLWKTSRSDLDNCLKSIIDGIAVVMNDDAQIVWIEASKLYAAKGEEPHVCIRLEPAV
jgi:Holliday junction resolvase RusA-like endonuclease